MTTEIVYRSQKGEPPYTQVLHLGDEPVVMPIDPYNQQGPYIQVEEVRVPEFGNEPGAEIAIFDPKRVNPRVHTICIQGGVKDIPHLNLDLQRAGESAYMVGGHYLDFIVHSVDRLATTPQARQVETPVFEAPSKSRLRSWLERLRK